MSIMSKPDHWIKKILVATPIMGRDSTFHKSVILLYEESVQHIAGLVLNKPTKTPVKTIFKMKGFTPINLSDMVFSGGPVSQEAIMILHSDEWKCNNTLRLNNGFSLTSDANMMKKIHEQDKPKRWRVYSGLSLWNPGQLEGEINSKCWMVVESPTADLILETNPLLQWQKAIDQCSKQMIDKYL